MSIQNFKEDSTTLYTIRSFGSQCELGNKPQLHILPHDQQNCNILPFRQ